MMAADDEILQPAQPKGFKTNAVQITPDHRVTSSNATTKKKKNISLSLRRVTPEFKRNDDFSSPTTSSAAISTKLFFGGMWSAKASAADYDEGGKTPKQLNGTRRVRSIEREQKMQDEYYEPQIGYEIDHEREEEELDDGELPSLSSPQHSLASKLKTQLSTPLKRQTHAGASSFSVENSPAALLVTSTTTDAAAAGRNTKTVTPTSESNYETLKVAGFWSQLDTDGDDDSDDEKGNKAIKKLSTNKGRGGAEEEEMPNDERQWRRSLSPPRNRGTAAAAGNNSIGLSLVQNTSSGESTVKTGHGENGEAYTNKSGAADNRSGGGAAASGGNAWNLLDMARCFAADHRLLEEEDQSLDHNYNPNARMVNNGRSTPFSQGDTMTYKTGATSEYSHDEEEEGEGIIENICIQLGNICGFGGEDGSRTDTKSKAHSIISKRKQKHRHQHQNDDDDDSVFNDLDVDGQEDVAIELGYVEPDATNDATNANNANLISPKKKKKGWKSFLGIKKKNSSPRKTLVTETTMSGRKPIDGDTTKVSDLNAAHTYSGDGLNPLDDESAALAKAPAVRSLYADDNEELESQAAAWDARRKNLYLRQLASQAKRAAASGSVENDDDEDAEESRRQDALEAYTADYANFNPSDKSKFLRYLNTGMSPRDATRAVVQERESALVEENETRGGLVEGPRTRSSRVPDDEEVVTVQSEDPPGVRKGESGESAELSARDEEDVEEVQGPAEELESQPVSQLALDSKNTPPEAYQDRAMIPMVPAIVRAKPRSKSREKHGQGGHEAENQDGLVSSGIQYYDTVPGDRADDEFDDDDDNLLKKRSTRIGRPRLSKPHLSSNIASSFASRVASKRSDSAAGKSKSKYGKVSENNNSFEERAVSPALVVEGEEIENREAESAFNMRMGGEGVSLPKPKTIISFDLMQRNKEKKFSKLESDVDFAIPSVSAKSKEEEEEEDDDDEESTPSWTQSTAKDTVSSAFSPPIEDMDDEPAENDDAATAENEAEDVSSPTNQIIETEYDEGTMSLMGQTFMKGAALHPRRRRHKGAADTRVASAKEAESNFGAKNKGWIGSIQDVASKNGHIWHPEKGWISYSEPEVEHHKDDIHSSIGRLHVPQNRLPQQAKDGGFTSPRSVAGTVFDDQSVITKLTVNTAVESPSILTTAAAPTKRAGRKPSPTDQRKIAAARADRPIGWKDSMQSAANSVDGNGGFRWDYKLGWIRIDGTVIDDDAASALTESIFYNDGVEVEDRGQSELLPVTEETSDADSFSDDDEDVFKNVDEKREVITMSANEKGASARTVDYYEKYGIYKVNSDDGSEKENSPANNVGVPSLLTTGNHDREDDVSEDEPGPDSSAVQSANAPAQERSNPLLARIMAARDEPKFEDKFSKEDISREPVSRFTIAQDDAISEDGPSRDPSGHRASEFNSTQEDPSGKTSIVATSKAPQAPKRSLNSWLQSSKISAPQSLDDTEESHLPDASFAAVKSTEASGTADSFNLEESFEDEGVFANTQVIKEKFSDTESDLFQPFESEIKKNTLESFESEGAADNEWVSTTLKRKSPLTTTEEVSQKASVWMNSMQKEGEIDESSESESNEPQVNQMTTVCDDERKADPPQNLDPPSANIDTRSKKRAANSWIKTKGDDENPSRTEVKSLQAESKKGDSPKSNFEDKINSAIGGKENDVIFQSQAMGIRLKRGEDGFVRVVSVTEASLGSSIDRVGAIEPGDTIVEAAGIDLRSPITNSEWGEAVTQIRHAPRPMKFIVAAGPERNNKEMSSKPIHSSFVPPSRITGGRNVVEYKLSKNTDGQQVLESVKEYRRHYSPERSSVDSPARREYGLPDRSEQGSPSRSGYGSPSRSGYGSSPDRTYYTEASSVMTEDLPKDSFFNRIAACATAGAAACAPGGARSSENGGDKTQVPMAHLQFLRTNPTITRVTNAAKNRYPILCGRPDTIFEEPDGGSTNNLGNTKSGAPRTTDRWHRSAAYDDESKSDRSRSDTRTAGSDQSRASSARIVSRGTAGDNTAFLENLAMKTAVSSKPSRPKTEGNTSSMQPGLLANNYSSGKEVGWPESNEVVTWPKDTIDNVSTFSNNSGLPKRGTPRQAEILAAAKVEAMMEDNDHDEDSECEI